MPLRTTCINWNEVPLSIGSPWPEEVDPTSTYYDDTFTSFLSTSGDQYRFSTIADAMDIHSYSSMYPTAAVKQEILSSAFSSSFQKDWLGKSVKQWTSNDVMNWAFNVVEEQEKCDYELLKIDKFRVEGMTLRSWTESDFIERDPIFGSTLYYALQTVKAEEAGESKSAYERLLDNSELKYNLPSFNNIRLSSDRLSPALVDSVSSTLTELKVATDRINFTDSESDQGDCFLPIKKEDCTQDQSIVKKKRGRPVGNRSKRKPEKKCGRLWEFIRDLLLKPEYCPSLICWEDHDEGVFRFVRSDKVAELWGTIKENPKMTYEKLSRAMRYYYKSKVLQPVLGRRLVYKFGPTAKGWRTDNPNFRQPIPCE